MANTLSFDEQFYLTQNPDVAAAVSRGLFANGADHYNQFGRFEARNPNAFFDTAFYLGQYPDVAAAGINPLTHFLNFGVLENRATNATELSSIDTDGNGLLNEFDSAAYLAQYTDVADGIANGTIKSAYQHFIQFGQFEGRVATLADGTTITGPFSNTGTAPGTGATSTLTAGIDNLPGTNGDDTFVGSISDVAASNTLQSGDVINGGSGTDTLRIVSNNAAGNNNAGNQNIIPTLTSVENIEYQGFGSATNTINLTNATGVQNVSLVSGNGSLEVTNATNLLTAAASNTTGGTLTVGYAAAVTAGTADVQNVSLNNTAATAVAVDGVETINIAATGTNTAAQVAGNSVTAVNVSGAGSLALANQFAATVTTFNASNNTGGVSAIFADGGAVTATGGAGNDTFNFGTGLTATAGGVAGDVVDGGAGFDTVRVSNAVATSYEAAAAAAPFNALTNIERVGFDGEGGVTLNGSTFTNTGITNIEFNTAGGLNIAGDDVINNAGSARTYEFGTANNGSATFNMSATSSTLNIALNGTSGTAAANDGTAADVDGIIVNLAATAPANTVTTININSMGDLAEVVGNGGLDANFNNVGVINAVAGSTINVTGAGNLDIDGLTNRGIINASTATGNLVIQGSNFVEFAAAQQGGSATAFVSGADTITLGAGQNVVEFGNALASGVINTTDATTTAQGLIVDVINGFKAGANGDVLDFTAVAQGGQQVDSNYTALTSEAQTQINALSGATATLQAAANIAVAATAQEGGANGEWTAFTFQGQTYAVYDANDDGSANNGPEVYTVGTDLLVQLSGVNVASLTDANFA